MEEKGKKVSHFINKIGYDRQQFYQFLHDHNERKTRKASVNISENDIFQ